MYANFLSPPRALSHQAPTESATLCTADDFSCRHLSGPNTALSPRASFIRTHRCRRQVNRKVGVEAAKGSAKISCLSMYGVPPSEKLSVTEFEEYAYDRLRCIPRRRPVCHLAFTSALPEPKSFPARAAVLNMIDMARAKGLKGTDLEKVIRKARDDCMPNTQAGMRKDHFSHFILRLAYCRRHCPPSHASTDTHDSGAGCGTEPRAPCRSEDLRRWFLQNEVELFKWRFVNNPPDDMNQWLKAHSLNYEAVCAAPTPARPAVRASAGARAPPRRARGRSRSPAPLCWRCASDLQGRGGGVEGAAAAGLPLAAAPTRQRPAHAIRKAGALQGVMPPPAT